MFHLAVARKERRYGYYNFTQFLYVVLDYQRRAANPDVPDVCLRVEYDIPSAQQVVSDVQRDVQCSAVLVHRDIQDFLNSV